MKELGEALKAIFDKIGQFLDLFDLSFFISGAVATGAGWIWLYHAHHLPALILPSWVSVLMLLIIIYTTGLVCFAIGRLFRTLVPKTWNRLRRKPPHAAFDSCFLATLQGHQLDTVEPFRSYLAVTRVRGIWALYVRLWAELRTDPAMAASMAFLNREWVMSATYDGLALALLLWAGVAASFTFGWGVPAGLGLVTGIVTSLALIIAASACLYEAERHAEYLIYELVAATATRLRPPSFNLPTV